MQPADTGEPADIPDDNFNRKDTMGRTLKYDDMGKRVGGKGKTLGRPPIFNKISKTSMAGRPLAKIRQRMEARR